jgi:hydrogenase maturation protease
MGSYWEALERPGPDAITAPGGGELRAGSRVRLRPRPGGDVFDLALSGRTAVIEAIEQDMEDNVRLAVVVEDDPGRDLGFARQPGHRFFFSPEEVELLEASAAPRSRSGAARVLVAGIGNVFLGDDGFGVALADRLSRRALPAGTEVVDFGIRGMDLAFAMQDGYDAVVMLDAAPRGDAPGTLYVIEADLDECERPAVDAHGMDPVTVLGLVRALGGTPPLTYVVACEPERAIRADRDELVVELSEPVRAALDPAVRLVESLLAQISTTQEVSST